MEWRATLWRNMATFFGRWSCATPRRTPRVSSKHQDRVALMQDKKMEGRME